MDSRSPAVRIAARLLLVLAVSAAGCTSWRSAKEAPNQLVAKNPGISIRVTPEGHKPLVIHDLIVSPDTIYGLTDSPSRGYPWVASTNKKTRQVAIAQSDIKKLQIQKVDAVKTTVLVIGIGVTVAAVVAVAASSSSSYGFSGGGGGGDYGYGDSCPLILCPSEGGWRIDSGTYAGAIMPALARSDVDNLDYATAKDGRVRVRLTGLPGETEHVNALALLRVDHHPGTTVAPDGNGKIWALGRLEPPRSVRDLQGRDALRRVRERDEWCWESALMQRDPSSSDALRDGLEIEFPLPENVDRARLVIDGANTPWAMHMMREAVAMHGTDTQAWYDAAATDPERAQRLKRALARESFLHVKVWTGSEWEYQGSVTEVGAESLKRQVVSLDLSRIEGDAVRVRLECAPNLWLVDCAAIDYSPERTVDAVPIEPETARTLEGRDVRDLILSEDGSEYAITPGDTAEVAFRVPPIPAGMKRTYLARTTGWYHIDTPETGEPRTALLDRMETEPGAVARYSITRMNQALADLAVASDTH